jgi:hypothetical protein
MSDVASPMKLMLDAGVPSPAVALMMVNLAVDLQDLGRANLLENLLHKVWIICARNLTEVILKEESELTVAVLFLEQYFHHRGNWADMKAEMTLAVGRISPSLVSAMNAESKRMTTKALKDIDERRASGERG